MVFVCPLLSVGLGVLSPRSCWLLGESLGPGTQVAAFFLEQKIIGKQGLPILPQKKEIL